MPTGFPDTISRLPPHREAARGGWRSLTTESNPRVKDSKDASSTVRPSGRRKPKRRSLECAIFDFGQATKGARWMPWRREARKDAASCDKPRGAANRL